MSRMRFALNLPCVVVFKDLLARNKRDICNLSNSNKIQTQKYLVRKPTLNHLTKLAFESHCCHLNMALFELLFPKIPFSSFQFPRAIEHCLTNIKRRIKFVGEIH